MGKPLLSSVETFKELARRQAAERDRERVKIGFIFDIPPAQLSDEQIRKYRQEILMRRYAALIPALRQPISILHIK